MSVYCKGATAAEVLFSLTGGREGRIISYAPPVEVFFAKSAKRFTVKKQYANYASTSFDRVLLYATAQETNATGIYWEYAGLVFFSKFASDIEPIAGNEFKARYYIFSFVKDSYKLNPENNIFYLYQRESLYKELFSGIINFYYATTKTELKNVLIIQDTEGILYCHEVPEGFTPTWQVNCIGCNPGECSGSDGQGGVICMDCKQMDRDLQAIKKSLR